MESLFPAALRHIETAIEEELLIEAFGKTSSSHYFYDAIPLRTHIEREVIVNQVVKDIQLFDSKESRISLDGLPVKEINDTHSTIYIPEGRRGGRDIMSILGVSLLNETGYGVGSTMATNGFQNSVNSMLTGIKGVAPSAEFDAEWYAPNTIIVNNRFGGINSGILHVNLGVDNRLTHIRNTTSLPFIEMCIWKTKQLIYTKLNIAISRNKISNGKELGVFADSVREFRGARDTYMELMNKFRVTVALADPVKRKALISTRMPRIYR